MNPRLGLACEGFVSSWSFGFLSIQFGGVKKMKVDWEQKEDHQIKQRIVHGTLASFRLPSYPFDHGEQCHHLVPFLIESSPTVSDSLSVVA